MISLRTLERVQAARWRCLTAFAVSAALVGLAGCAPKRMRSDFIGFEKAYADTSNREVLLNLARLQKHDTTYFFKLGQISSSYRMQATLGTAGNYTIPTAGIGGNATGGGTPGLLYENDPSFTFIPVNDETSAQLLLKPIPAQTFYNLYLQGWRVDQLFRLMVDRIELTIDDGKVCRVQTLRNAPPPKGGSPTDAAYLAQASSYATFLRVSGLVWGLQRHGHLLLQGTSTFVAYGSGGVTPGGPAADNPAPKASDIAAAAAKGDSWQYDPKQNKWMFGAQVAGGKFYLNPLPDEVKAAQPAIEDPYDILQDASLKSLQVGSSLREALGVLGNGFSIEEAPRAGASNALCAPAVDGDNADTGKADGSKRKPGTSAHLVMRSLLGLMSAAAQEEDAYDTLNNANPLLPKQPTDAATDKAVTFKEAVPLVEQQPALRIKPGPDGRSDSALVSVGYHGTTYLIADSARQPADNQYWNRDMFRLINQLTAQVTVDISKFPLPGILQVHQ